MHLPFVETRSGMAGVGEMVESTVIHGSGMNLGIDPQAICRPD